MSVASWEVGAGAGPFDGDFGGIFFGDEQSTFHHNTWAGATDVPSLSPLLSASTRTGNDESGMCWFRLGAVCLHTYAATVLNSFAYGDVTNSALYP